MEFQRYVFDQPYLGWLLRGVGVTLFVTVLTTVSSLLLGMLVVFMRTAARPGARAAARVYIALFRNIPLVPLLLFLVFAVPGAFKALTGSTFPAGNEFLLLVLGLSLNTSAYIAEILRSGIRAIPAAQADAARVLGLVPMDIRLRVIYPQAMRIVLPDLGTRLIHNMKNSSVALVLPLPVEYMEVVGQAGRIAGQTFSWAGPLVFAACTHLAFAALMGLVVARLAARAQLKVEVSQ